MFTRSRDEGQSQEAESRAALPSCSLKLRPGRLGIMSQGKSFLKEQNKRNKGHLTCWLSPGGDADCLRWECLLSSPPARGPPGRRLHSPVSAPQMLKSLLIMAQDVRRWLSEAGKTVTRPQPALTHWLHAEAPSPGTHLRRSAGSLDTSVGPSIHSLPATLSGPVPSRQHPGPVCKRLRTSVISGSCHVPRDVAQKAQDGKSGETGLPRETWSLLP